MKKYPFGKDFTYRFTPYANDDGDPVVGMPSHTATALIYSSQPSRSQVVAETGEVATSTATWAADGTSCDFDIDAIVDPDSSSEDYEATYWIAFKYKLQTAGDDQITILALPLVRSSGTGSALTVFVADVVKVNDKVLDYWAADTITEEILNQRDLLRAELGGKGYEWANLTQPSQLAKAVVFATLGALFASESEGDGDKWDKQSKRYDSNAESYLELIQVEYDDSKVKGQRLEKAPTRGAIRGRR